MTEQRRIPIHLTEAQIRQLLKLLSKEPLGEVIEVFASVRQQALEGMKGPVEPNDI